MTPKEKAKELVDKYDDTLTYLESKSKAKQCALIAVDEIINANPYKWVPFMNQYSESVLASDISYWQEVKQEILKEIDQ